jgi:hypothetical protein
MLRRYLKIDMHHVRITSPSIWKVSVWRIRFLARNIVEIRARATIKLKTKLVAGNDFSDSIPCDSKVSSL